MKKVILFISILFAFQGGHSQVGINTDGSLPHASAGLDVNFNDKGFLLPRMTYNQRNAIIDPAEGLLIYCTNCIPRGQGAVNAYIDGKWVSISLCLTPQPTPTQPSAALNQITWRWSGNATGYKWNTVLNYDDAIDLGSNKYKTETGIICDTTYLRYVWAYTVCGISNSAMLVYTTQSSSPSAPVSAIHAPSPRKIVWKWNRVANATGYRWNTTNNYSTSIDLGIDTIKSEFYLTCNTPYIRYVWAYNICGVSGATTLNQTTSICPPCSAIIDNRDGKSYNVVMIGSQCWMAQNLDIGTRVIGSSDQSDNQIIEKYCHADWDSDCDVYGGLYQWGEAVNYLNGASNWTSWNPAPEGVVQGICPNGWHLPNETEWLTLSDYLGGPTVAGGKMKEAGTSHWFEPNTGATNSSGFTALAAGYRDNFGNWYNWFFFDNYYKAYFWTIKDHYSYYAHFWELKYNYANLETDFEYKSWGLSLRCLQD